MYGLCVLQLIRSTLKKENSNQINYLIDSQRLQMIRTVQVFKLLQTKCHSAFHFSF